MASVGLSRLLPCNKPLHLLTSAIWQGPSASWFPFCVKLPHLDVDFMYRSEHTRRSLTEKEMAVADKDRQIAELQRQVAELQAKTGGSMGSAVSPPVVPADTRAGVWLI